MPDLIGQSLGRYQILEQLGEGGMAMVYRAYDTRLEREVAIKIIRKGAFPPEQLDRILKRFEREAKALARLSHSHIIKFHEFGEYEGAPYLVMDYMPGRTLKERLGKPIPWQDAARLVVPIMGALEYAHSQGIIHRDVKPSNILIAANGEAMLTDFGVAKLLETEETQTLTGTGVGIGTPEYMSPEQGLGQAIDARADIYSLGIILYEMVTGKKPYTADTPMAVVVKQINDPLPRPKQYVRNLPDGVEKILLKALAKKPENRYPSMAALASAIETQLAKVKKPVVKAPKPKKKKAKETRGIVGREKAPVLLEDVTRDQGLPELRSNQKVRKKPITKAKKISRNTWFFVFGGLGTVALVIILAVFSGWPEHSMIVPTQTKTKHPIQNPLETSTPAQSLVPRATNTTTQSPILTKTHTIAATYTVAPNIISTVTPVDTWLRSIDGMVMVYVPAGEFEMGSNDGTLDEQPVHTVFLDAYWIDRTEVTNGMYALCVGAGECASPIYGSSSILQGNYGDPQYDDYPVQFASWAEAEDYCKWVGARLPTEAEWEKAARGTESRTYPWGETPPDCSLLNFARNCVGETTIVGSYPLGASPYGALDMAGNVAEWVADWYDETYYSQSPVNNPQGPSSGSVHVRRGGDWYWSTAYMRSADRDWGYMAAGGRSGFRCARSVDGP